MIPLHDNIPPRSRPVVNYLMIGACALVFLLQLAEGDDGTLVYNYGMIPARVTHPSEEIGIVEPQLQRTPYGDQVVQVRRVLQKSAFPAWLTLLTCIFLHGGWMHFLGNMWFLHIFGDNVEDRFGHFGYLIFYLGSGVAASAAHLISTPNSAVPTIGASGAIAGVMGAYFVLYPHAKVVTLIPIVFIQLITVPAPLFLGIWFVIQLVQSAMVSGEAGGVAWWAHIGGFVAGMAIAWFLGRTDHLNPPARPAPSDVPHSIRFRHRDDPRWF